MSTLLTVAELRDHLECDLTDDALQTIIDSEDTYIVEKFGPHADAGIVTTVLSGRQPMIFLSQRALAIISVTETRYDEDTLLDAGDYRLWSDGRYIERLSGGSPYWTPEGAAWGDRISVVFTPRDIDPMRKMVLINLCKLTSRYEAMRAETAGVGEYRFDYLDYLKERRNLIKPLRMKSMVFA